MSRYYIYCKKADFKKISETFHISPMLARILRNRDLVSEGEIDEYLNGGTDRFHDPFLMKGIKEAVPLIFDALNHGDKIRVIGDYDTDGVCSSYILKQYLMVLGGKVDVRLPDRMAEGYGMNPDMVKEAVKDGIKLIITCDNGVSAYEAVKEASDSGIRVIVSDHHEVPLPLVDADALIDVKQPEDPYPYKELCGAGVAYKIVCALHKTLQWQNSDEALLSNSERMLDELLQFVGIATIADVVPLTAENRILAKEGLNRLQNTKNEGLKALMRERHIESARLSSYHIGFILAPCLNSAGRLKNADIALDLLEVTDPGKAEMIAAELSMLNDERKNMTQVQTAVAEKMVEQMTVPDGKLPKILVLYLPDAHESIAGIIAGRLKELFCRPVIVVTDSETGLKGSGRSVDLYNMAVELRAQSDLFLKLGGHAKAAGFSLAEGVSVGVLSEKLNAACLLTDEELNEKKWIDMQLPFQYVSEDFVRELELLEPFGLKNEKPVFAEKDVRVRRVFVLGRNNNVLKLLLENSDGIFMEGIKYGSEEKITNEADLLINGSQDPDFRISFTYYPTVNEFRGERNLQLQILDFIF